MVHPEPGLGDEMVNMELHFSEGGNSFSSGGLPRLGSSAEQRGRRHDALLATVLLTSRRDFPREATTLKPASSNMEAVPDQRNEAFPFAVFLGTFLILLTGYASTSPPPFLRIAVRAVLRAKLATFIPRKSLSTKKQVIRHNLLLPLYGLRLLYARIVSTRGSSSFIPNWHHPTGVLSEYTIIPCDRPCFTSASLFFRFRSGRTGPPSENVPC